MASKKTATRKKSDKRRKANAAVKVFSLRARDELARLLRRNRAGTITRRDLDTGLREVEENLTRLLHFKKHLL